MKIKWKIDLKFQIRYFLKFFMNVLFKKKFVRKVTTSLLNYNQTSLDFKKKKYSLFVFGAIS